MPVRPEYRQQGPTYTQAEAVLNDLLKAGVAERKTRSINDILEPTRSENRVNFQYKTRVSIRCKSAFWTAFGLQMPALRAFEKREMKREFQGLAWSLREDRRV